MIGERPFDEGQRLLFRQLPQYTNGCTAHVGALMRERPF